jgi:UDP-2,3-diacylglucosamine hydrolase
MNSYFISDLHLSAENTKTTHRFLSFLQSILNKADSLYILGDFFDTWIGDDDQSPFHNEIIHALKQASDSGIALYFMHGNRDFLLGKRFMRATGARLLKDPTVIKLNGAPTLLMHGDTLCTDDKDYLAFRKKVRNPLLQRLFLWKSLQKRKAIAEKMRAASQLKKTNKPEDIMDVSQSEVLRVMEKHGVTQLIHGHTHRPAMHELILDGKPAKRLVLSDWDNVIKIIEVAPNTPLQLTTLTPL